MPDPHASPDAFDDLAADYDETFTASLLGKRMRHAVWRRLDACFAPGETVLELGCGTGEDALHLARRGLDVVALDRSAEMVDAARRKVGQAGLGDRIRVLRMALEQWAAHPHEIRGPSIGARPFDGAYSNFGVLNCVADLGPVAETLAALVRPGARVVLVIMGPLVPWEWIWFLARGRPGEAFRRLARDGVDWRGLVVRYPGIREVRRIFRPGFRPLRVSAIGALLPPSYAESWAARRPRLIGRLDALERRLETWPPLPALADHYLLELERR